MLCGGSMRSGKRGFDPDIPRYRTSIISMLYSVQTVGRVWIYGSPPCRDHLLAYHCHGEVLVKGVRKARRSGLYRAKSICMTAPTP